MFRGGSIVLRILFTLILIGLLAAGGVLLYRAGYAQGYQAAALVAQSANGAAPQAPQLAPYGYLYPPYLWPGYGFHFFSPFPILFGIGFILLFFFLVGGIFRAFAWRRWAGHPGMGGWGHHAERFAEWEAWRKQREGEKTEKPEDKPKE